MEFQCLYTNNLFILTFNIVVMDQQKPNTLFGNEMIRFYGAP